MKEIFYILDKDSYEVVYGIENYKYALWNDRYDECGDFEIQVYPTKELMQYAKIDNYIINPSNKVDNQTMVIENYELDLNESGEVMMKITGRSTECLLERRIIGMKTIFRNNLEDCFKQIIKHCFWDLNFIVIGADPPDGLHRPSSYKVNNLAFVYSSNSDVTSATIKETEFGIGTNVLQIITQLCQAKNLGFEMPLHREYDDITLTISGDHCPYNKFVFKTLRYTDRSNIVVFSRSIDNLVSSDYKKSKQDYKNVIYIYGKEYNTDEDAKLKTKLISEAYAYDDGNLHPSGFEVREFATEAGDLDFKVTDIYGVETTLSSTEYANLFSTRANKLRYDNRLKEESDAKIIEGEGYTYNKDFYIGDLVGADDGFGNILRMQVCEYITSYDQNGVVGYPKFRVFDAKPEG